ncbi:cytochrome P450 domain-containing protein [Rhizoctonia solani AG-1 IA]|uniref:Cytochrome P450 domain-containing protein n=1 Tax=Thanatephorus cucumeris (strain AG1-IA) TaxID=983506 RepID=L8WWX8_THACA|nr:cytochrome P450 domain-containing protein [Rhizoctonia solani AG-1 IA]
MYIHNPSYLTIIPPPSDNATFYSIFYFWGTRTLSSSLVPPTPARSFAWSPSNKLCDRNVLKAYGPTVRMTGVMGVRFGGAASGGFVNTDERSKFERNKGGALMVRSLFGGGLAGLRGEEHRQQRKYSRDSIFRNVSAPFMFPWTKVDIRLRSDVAKQTCNAIDKSLSTGVIDIIPWTTAAALELIGEAGLGYSFSSFNGEKNEYSTAIKSVGQLLSKLVPFIPIYPYFVRLPVTRKALSYVRIPLLRQVLKATSLQNEQAEKILRTRQDMLTKGTDLESVTGRGKDILTQLNFESILIFAGHETTSSMIARILDILSNNLEIQEKLRGEVLECGEDNVLDLSYLDAVVKEALRLYPPASYLGRMCEEDTVVPLSYPISTASGVITSLPIKKGTRLALSIIFSNRDEKVWGKRAGEFWPERWLESEQLGDPEIMIAQLLRSFKFEPSGEDYAWEVSPCLLMFDVEFGSSRDKIAGVSNPYLSKERGETTRLPKLPLKVSRL